MSTAFPDTTEDKPAAKVELRSDLGERAGLLSCETGWS
jgi:hypothetical protein